MEAFGAKEARVKYKKMLIGNNGINNGPCGHSQGGPGHSHAPLSNNDPRTFSGSSLETNLCCVREWYFRPKRVKQIKVENVFCRFYKEQGLRTWCYCHLRSTVTQPSTGSDQTMDQTVVSRPSRSSPRVSEGAIVMATGSPRHAVISETSQLIRDGRIARWIEDIAEEERLKTPVGA